MVMPQVNRDGSVPVKTSPRDKALPKLPLTEGNVIPRKPVANTVKIKQAEKIATAAMKDYNPGKSAENDQWPLIDQTNSLDENDAADLESLVSHPTITRTSPIREEHSDLEPLLTPEDRKPRRSSEIIHHGLLKAVGPAALPPPGPGATTSSSLARARRNYRMLSSDSLLGDGTSPTLRSRFKATFVKKVRSPYPMVCAARTTC